MATRFSSALFADNSTDANFRAWAQFIEDTLVTTGAWVVTSDTGQTTPSTLAHPTTTSQKKGYRIYRMDDALQATSPVFMRIDFGSNSAAANTPAIWPTIGTGSDGSGGITGKVWDGGASAAPLIGNSGNSSATANNSYGSASTSRFSLAMFIQSGNTALPFIFTLERTKDANGADTSAGLLLVYTALSSSVSSTRFLWLAGGTQPTAETGMSYVITRQNPSETFGGDIGVGVVIHFRGVSQQPGTNGVVVNSSDVSAEGSVNLTLYGATRTYQHCNSIATTKALSGSSATDSNARFMIRYD